MNGLLDAKRAEQDAQIAFVHELLAKAEADGGRDLVEAEQKSLTAARERIDGLSAQIGPMEEFEARTARIAESRAVIAPPRRNGAASLGASRADASYSTAGAFVVDILRAKGLMRDDRGARMPADTAAEARIRYAVENQTTADTPGLLPHPIIGSVVSLIDASRPLISSIGGARPMGNVGGKTFGRPKVTQHVDVGPQTAEKTQLPSRKMVIGEIPFTKSTYGGVVDVSRQDIDWSSPAAWDILVRDLADVYAVETEEAVAADFLAKSDDINAATAVGGATLADWSTALYAAAALVYGAAKRLPDRVWCSVDVWGILGPLTDLSAPVSAGDSALDSFAGNLFRIPRIVVPSWPAGSCVIGAASAYEAYEEVIGLLTAVEPSLLGVEVAYGGYVAYNAVTPEALAPITPPAVVPLAGGRRARTSETE